MKTTKMIVIAGLMMLGTINASAQDTTQSKEIIQIDEQQVPVCYVNKTVDELRAAFTDLETILETDNFQLYQAGDYSFKVEKGQVVSQSIQFEDPKDEKVLYKKILFRRRSLSRTATTLAATTLCTATSRFSSMTSRAIRSSPIPSFLTVTTW